MLLNVKNAEVKTLSAVEVYTRVHDHNARLKAKRKTHIADILRLHVCRGMLYDIPFQTGPGRFCSNEIPPQT